MQCLEDQQRSRADSKRYEVSYRGDHVFHCSVVYADNDPRHEGRDSRAVADVIPPNGMSHFPQTKEQKASVSTPNRAYPYVVGAAIGEDLAWSAWSGDAATGELKGAREGGHVFAQYMGSNGLRHARVRGRAGRVYSKCSERYQGAIRRARARISSAELS